jgi:hypothetical protein
MASEQGRPGTGGQPNDAQFSLTNPIPLGHALDLLIDDPFALAPSLRQRLKDWRDGERYGHERGYQAGITQPCHCKLMEELSGRTEYQRGFADGYQDGYGARGDWDA